MDDGGFHYVLDLVVKDEGVLKDEKWLKRYFSDFLQCCSLTTLDFMEYKFGGVGEGVTGIFLLSESHLSYHTYPESNYISIDLYTCGSDPKEHINTLLADVDKSSILVRSKVTFLQRGTCVTSEHEGLQNVV